MTMHLTIALVAHDRTKPDLTEWVQRHETALVGHQIVATGTTGQMLRDAWPLLVVERVKSGPFGGDQQIGSLIAEGRLDALIFFADVMAARRRRESVASPGRALRNPRGLQSRHGRPVTGEPWFHGPGGAHPLSGTRGDARGLSASRDRLSRMSERSHIEPASKRQRRCCKYARRFVAR